MIEEPHSPGKQLAWTSQTSFTAAAIGQSSLGSCGMLMCVSTVLKESTATLWHVDVRVYGSQGEHSNSAVTVLSTTIK